LLILVRRKRSRKLAAGIASVGKRHIALSVVQC
jgi:hypothetical protein